MFRDTITFDRQTDRRVLWIDICRGIAALFVVMGHTSSIPYEVHKWIYGFHMPLFYFLSGYTFNFNSQKIEKYVGKKVKRLIIPYFIMSAINLLIVSLMLVLKGEFLWISFFRYLVGILWSIGNKNWMPNCSPLWFCTGLFSCYCIIFFIFRVCRTIWKRAFACIVCACISSVIDYMDASTRLPWNFSSALMGTPFLFIGYYFAKGGILKKWETIYKASRSSLLLLSLFLGTIFIFMNVLDYVSFDDNEYGNVLLMYAGAIMLVSFWVLLSSNLVGSARFYRILPCFAWIGRHTMFIMGFNYFANAVYMNTVSRFFIDTRYDWIIQFGAVIAILVAGVKTWDFFIRRIPDKNITQYLNW